MSYHRASVLRLRDEAFHLCERLSDGAFRSQHTHLVDWLGRARSTLSSAPSDVTSVIAAAQTLGDALASGSSDSMETAVCGALRKLAGQLQRLVEVCDVPAPAVDDEPFLGFLEAALRLDKQMIGSTPINPADVARRTGIDADVVYLCVVRACDEGLAHLPGSKEPGFHIEDDEIPDAARLLRSALDSKSAKRAAIPLEPDKEAVQVLIVTALPLEAAAVVAHLEDIREDVHARGSIYQVGVLVTNPGRIKVAVVKTGPGNALSAQETERALAHYKPRIALFVGIAGGRKDVNIGDVVIASKVYGYESGKDEADGFRTRPEGERPTYKLQQRAEHEAQRDSWLDRLLQHPTEKPRVVAGAVASGQKVVASSTSHVSSLLGNSYGDALAVEMEGLGFLQACRLHGNVQAVVIRGISDLLDGKLAADASGTQPRAAAHASAFALEVVAAYLRPTRPSVNESGHSRESSNESNKPIAPETTTSPFDGWLYLPPKASLKGESGQPILPIVYQISATLDPPPSLTKSELDKAVGESTGTYSIRNFGRVSRWPRAFFFGERRTNEEGLLWVFEWEPTARNEAGDEQLFAGRRGKFAFQRDIFWDVEAPSVDIGLIAEDAWKFLRFMAVLASRLEHAGELHASLRLVRPASHAALAAHFTGIDAERDCSAEITLERVAGHVSCGHQVLLENDQLAKVTKRLVDQVANDFEARFSAFDTSRPIIAVSLSSLAKSIERGVA